MSSRAKRRRHNADLRRKDETRLCDFRSFTVRAATIDDKERSIEAVIASETPVVEYDWQRDEMLPRVLLASGVVLPDSRQVPLLDSHSRFSVSSQLGSIRGVRTDRSEVVGRLYFSSKADDEWTKVREGHVTDVSAGFRVLEETYVPRGQTQKIAGRDFTGPINVATRWQLKEGSITPIGADEAAKMRAEARPRSSKESFKMNPELRALCIAQGMDEKLSDDEAVRWMQDNLTRKGQPGGKNAGGDGATTNAGQVDDARILKLIKDETDAREAKAATFRADVDALCDLAEVGNAQRYYALADLKAVREAIQKDKKEGAADVPSSFRIEAGAAQLEKHRGAVGTALVLRAVENTGVKQELIDKVFPTASRAKDADQFRNASLLDMARECLEMDGIRTRGASREQIAVSALGWPDKVGLRHGTPAYHVTASFPKLVQDAVNKSMQVGYMEFAATWRGPMRQAASVPDFKTIHRMRVGAVPNIPVWPDNTNPDQASFKDADETYALEAYSLELSFSWRLLVNDDMEVISRAPQQMGNAFSRTVNAAAWSQITSNPTMSDSVALFATATGNRKRDNLATGSATPTVSTVGAMTKRMRLMRGENTPEENEGADILNLTPRYIVGPAALEVTILQLVRSTYDPAASAIQVFNPYTGLIPVIEPLLDASSATAWYLFASPSQIDTVEVSFLQGQESPVTRDWTDERSLARCFAGLQTFAAKAMNHRGIQKHAGA